MCSDCIKGVLSNSVEILFGYHPNNAFQTISNNSKVNFFPQKLKK